MAVRSVSYAKPAVTRAATAPLTALKADGDELLKTVVGSDTAEDGWRDIAADLSSYAGSEIMLELLNRSNGCDFEIACWAKIAVVSE